jgi:hypothetical protein
MTCSVCSLIAVSLPRSQAIYALCNGLHKTSARAPDAPPRVCALLALFTATSTARNDAARRFNGVLRRQQQLRELANTETLCGRRGGPFAQRIHR